MGQPELPHDFPSGPYATLSMHMNRINRYAANPATGGGIWQIPSSGQGVMIDADGVAACVIVSKS